MNNGDMPAAPIANKEGFPSNMTSVHFDDRYSVTGLTKRERFALAALQGILSNAAHDATPLGVALDAVEAADALLEELEK